MKLIVTIPAFDEEATIADVIREVPRRIAGFDSVEVLVLDDGSRDETVEVARQAGADHVVSQPMNRGLAATFKLALGEALKRGADVIVNTDADNHYDQTRIPELVRPIVDREGDITIGSRLIDGLEMKRANRYGNKAANFMLQRLLSIPDVDVSTGFRAYSREAALKLNVLSHHTYTHETLLNALDQRLRIVNVPLAARSVARPSRLIKSIRSHVWRAGIVIVQSFLLYRPLQVYGLLGALLVIAGCLPFARFGYFAVAGNPAGHVQSLVIGVALWFMGGQMLALGMLAHAIAWNRRMIEEVLYTQKQAATAPTEGQAVAKRLLRAVGTPESEEMESVGANGRAA